MNQTDKLLIRDPYLQSDMKPQLPYAHESYLLNKAHDSSHQPYHQQTIQQYKHHLDDLQKAYAKQEIMGRKLLSFQVNSNQYHEAIKHRNYELNTKLNNLALQTQLMNKAYHQDTIKIYHDKDILIKRYEEQSQEILELKRTIGVLMQHKTKLEEQISHLMFILDKQGQQSQLVVKQQLLRAENMEKTYKQVIESRDQEVMQLQYRLRGYEDQNRRLLDQNRTLHLTSNRIDNLSQINQLDSQMKENRNQNKILIKNNTTNKKQHDTLTQLKQQKEQNQKLKKQIQEYKYNKKLFEEEKNQLQKSNLNHRNQSPIKKSNLFQISQSQGLINSITTLRNGINKQIFDIFFKSIRQGEKKRQNSLVIFIENWRCFEIDRVHPYIKSYLEARINLKNLIKKVKLQNQNYSIQQCIPLYVASRKGRNQINQWILSTIQFTKNQRETGKKNMNNALLFLFRLLTIEYRIIYPMQGKSYTIDTDVRNELLHEICKAVTYIIQLK